MRYTQLIKFKEIGEKGQKSFSEKTVTIVGLGNIGSTASVMLARSGINLRIIDKGRCEIDDLAGQCMYVEDDNTKFKAKQAKKRLEEINPGVKVRTFHEDLNKNNLYLLDADAVIDATGEKNISEMISDYTKKKKIPMIYALASGSEGLILTSDKGIDFAKLHKLIEKMKPVNEIGLINPAVHMAAALIVKKIMKIMLKKPYHKDAVLFNIWTDTVKKQKI
jgi:molybdopterin/thiamine biosynthesis adenylyltransferase